MNYRLIQTDKANRQLMEIAVYIAEESGDYETAIAVIEKLENALELLKEMPHRGSIPRTEALRKQGHRILIVGSYLIFYRCNDKLETITITAFVHSKQDYLQIVR